MQRRRTPVLLVHGWNARGRSLMRLADYLMDSGWPAGSVAALDFRDIWGSNREHAAEIAAAVEALMQRTASDFVDVVAHSMGGLATRWYIATCLAPAPIRRTVFIATPHRGTWMALGAWGDGGRELRPGSAFLRELSARPLPDHIRSYTIRTRLETHVVPPNSAGFDPATADHVVSFPPHAFLLRSRVVHRIVRDCLPDPGKIEPAEVVARSRNSKEPVTGS